MKGRPLSPGARWRKFMTDSEAREMDELEQKIARLRSVYNQRAIRDDLRKARKRMTSKKVMP